MRVYIVMDKPRRQAWSALSERQQGEALRLAVSAAGEALHGDVGRVVSVLSEAGDVSPGVEEHVRWAAGWLTDVLRPLGDRRLRAGLVLVEAVNRRDEELAALEQHVLAGADEREEGFVW